jgi:hypothetical protein
MEEVAQSASFILICRYHYADQVKVNEVGGACGTYGRGNCTRFWWESLKERDHLEDQGIDGRMGSEWILRRLAGGGGVEWIQFAQDRGR